MLPDSRHPLPSTILPAGGCNGEPIRGAVGGKAGRASAIGRLASVGVQARICELRAAVSCGAAMRGAGEVAGIGGIDLIGLLHDSLFGEAPPPHLGQVVQGVIESFKEGLALRVGDVELSITGDAVVNLHNGGRCLLSILVIRCRRNNRGSAAMCVTGYDAAAPPPRQPCPDAPWGCIPRGSGGSSVASAPATTASGELYRPTRGTLAR